MAVPMPIALPHDVVFAYGLYATGEVVEEKDYDKPDKPPKVDPETGKRAYSFSALDADPSVRGAAKSVKVTIYADVQPVLPAPADGSPFALVELEGLRVRPYVAEGPAGRDGKSRGRLAFSYRAAGVHAPKSAASSKAQTSAA